MYDFLTSIKKIDKKDSFEGELVDFLKEKIDFSRDWRMLSRDEVFEGGTIKRYVKLFNEISV